MVHVALGLLLIIALLWAASVVFIAMERGGAAALRESTAVLAAAFSLVKRLIERITGTRPTWRGADLAAVEAAVADQKYDSLLQQFAAYSPWSETRSWQKGPSGKLSLSISPISKAPAVPDYAGAVPEYESTFRPVASPAFPTAPRSELIQELLNTPSLPVLAALLKSIAASRDRAIKPPPAVAGPAAPPSLPVPVALEEPRLELPFSATGRFVRWLGPAVYFQERTKHEFLRREWTKKSAALRELTAKRSEAATAAKAAYERALACHNADLADAAAKHAQAVAERQRAIAADEQAMRAATGAYLQGSRAPPDVVSYFLAVLNNVEAAEGVRIDGTVAFDGESTTLVADLWLPHLPAVEFARPSKRNNSLVPLPEKQQRPLRRALHCALALRYCFELARSDGPKGITTFVVNGRVAFRDAATGQQTSACAATLYATGEELRALDLHHVDATAAFEGLRGRSVGEAYTVSPVVPVLEFNERDSRFIQGRDVLTTEGNVNLAAMAWDDFEHLVRQLFQLEYAAVGAKVEITRASRDRGVDAVVHDPDPMRGGKFIVQAKRYVNRVDVSAVRDLYGTLIAEGAARAILVTTSHFGPDAKEFAAGKSITLLEGPQLLGLLARHGFRYRIDLEEARAQLGIAEAQPVRE